MSSDSPASFKVLLSSLTKVVSSLIFALWAMIWAWWRGETWGWNGDGWGSLKGGGSNTAHWGEWLTSLQRWGRGHIWVSIEWHADGGRIDPPPLTIWVVYLRVKKCLGWMMEAWGTMKWRMNDCCRLGQRGGDGGCSDPYQGCSNNLDGPRIGKGELGYDDDDNCRIMLIHWGWVQGPVDGEAEV